MSRTVGQHIIPQFLLRRFDCRQGRKGVFSYCFRRGVGLVCEHGTNVRNIGKRRLFYGEVDETGVERELAAAEGRFADCLKRVLTHGVVEHADVSIVAELITNLSIRTSHFRHGFVDEVEDLMSCLVDHMSSADMAAIEVLLQKSPSSLRAPLADALTQAPDAPTEPAIRLGFLRRLEEQVKSEFPRLGHLFLPHLAGLGAVKTQVDWSKHASVGHINALKKSVAPAQRSELYATFVWSVQLVGGGVILGDCGPLGTDADGRLRPLFAQGKQVREIYLPVSKDQILVGVREGQSVPSINADTLNQAVAANSRDFFVSATVSQVEERYVDQLGKERRLLDPVEFEEITKDLAAPPSFKKSESGGGRVRMTEPDLRGLDDVDRRNVTDLARALEAIDVGLGEDLCLNLVVSKMKPPSRPHRVSAITEHATTYAAGESSLSFDGVRYDGFIWLDPTAVYDEGTHDRLLLLHAVMFDVMALVGTARDREARSEVLKAYKGSSERAIAELVGRLRKTVSVSIEAEFVLRTCVTAEVTAADLLAPAVVERAKESLAQLKAVGRVGQQVSAETIAALGKTAYEGLAAALGACVYAAVQCALSGHTAALAEHFEGEQVFSEVLRPDWESFWTALIEDDELKGTDAGVLAIERMLANLGVYFEDNGEGLTTTYARLPETEAPPRELLEEGRALADWAWENLRERWSPEARD